MKVFNKSLSVLLAVIMLLTSVPLQKGVGVQLLKSSGLVSDVTNYFVVYQGLGSLTNGKLLDDYFLEAHQPQTYMAYMMSLTSEQVTQERNAYKDSVN